MSWCPDVFMYWCLEVLMSCWLVDLMTWCLDVLQLSACSVWEVEPQAAEVENKSSWSISMGVQPLILCIALMISNIVFVHTKKSNQSKNPTWRGINRNCRGGRLKESRNQFLEGFWLHPTTSFKTLLNTLCGWKLEAWDIHFIRMEKGFHKMFLK